MPRAVSHRLVEYDPGRAGIDALKSFQIVSVAFRCGLLCPGKSETSSHRYEMVVQVVDAACLPGVVATLCGVLQAGRKCTFPHSI